MAQLEYRLLTPEEISDELANLTGWTVEEDRITKAFQFKDFSSGVQFAVQVAEEADKLNHHPDIHIRWGYVAISVNTHDVGGLSPYDFELASRIDSISVE